MKKKIIKVKFDKKGVAECIGKLCYGFTTYFYWKGKKLETPVVRCCFDTCYLDKESTKDINKHFTKMYPVKYKKPIEQITDFIGGKK